MIVDFPLLRKYVSHTSMSFSSCEHLSFSSISVFVNVGITLSHFGTNHSHYSIFVIGLWHFDAVCFHSQNPSFDWSYPWKSYSHTIHSKLKIDSWLCALTQLICPFLYSNTFTYTSLYTITHTHAHTLEHNLCVCIFSKLAVYLCLNCVAASQIYTMKKHRMKNDLSLQTKFSISLLHVSYLLSSHLTHIEYSQHLFAKSQTIACSFIHQATFRIYSNNTCFWEGWSNWESVIITFSLDR